MKHHVKYFLILGLFISVSIILSLLALSQSFEVWVESYLVSNVPNIKFDSQRLKYILLSTPWYSLVTLGCFCLWRLGWDLINYRDCSASEIPKLAKDIERAREDLRKRGYNNKAN